MEGGAAWKCFRWEYVSRRGARKERFCCVGARPGGIVRGKDARVSRLDGESPMRIECEMKVECPEAPFPVFPFQGEDMLRRVVLAALLVLGWFSADAQAHALLAKELASGDARVVAFSYSTGDVAAYAEAKLYGPDSADVEFQNGRTDAQGRFAFLPDKPGTWTIVVADNMGHKVSHPMTITLSDEGTVEREVAPSGFSESLRALPVLFRAVLGVSLLLNLFLGLALFRHRAGRRA